MILRVQMLLALAAVILINNVAALNIVGNTGPSTGQTPYVVPVAPGSKAVSVFSAGDSVNGGVYRMSGIPDGLGAFDNGDGTFTLLMNHEIPSTSGTMRAHGSIGGFVSKLKINKTTLQVVSAEDLTQASGVFLWNTTNNVFLPAGTTAFSRFCSADLPEVKALFNATTGNGTQERIFMNGEESADGRAFAHVVTGPNAGKSYQLAALGKMGFENSLANPTPQDKTIVISTDDVTGGPLYMYVGTKNSTGVTEVEKAGLTNGLLYGIKVTGALAEDRTIALGSAKGSARAFTLAPLGNVAAVSPLNAAGLKAAATAGGTTGFLRPEDGHWDPLNPADFYFVTTDQLDTVKDGLGTQIGRSRLYRLRFTSIASPETGGTITMLLDGTEAGNMFDNITIDKYGHILLEEDTGGVAHNSKIWLFDIASGSLELIAKHDPDRFGDVTVAATAPFNNNEESSGIIDMASILGEGWFMITVQSHYTSGQAPGAAVPIDPTLFEGGQLVALFVPNLNPNPAGISSSQTPYVLPAAPGVKTIAIMSAGDTVNKKPDNVTDYRMSGIPDGLGAFSNNDGTFTLLMNHEIPGTSGVMRAHGSLGAFVSKWTINTATLQVNKVEDLTLNNTSVFLWDTTNNVFLAGGTTPFSRFCSADLPDVNALFNPASGKGSQRRIFMNGEETTDGRAFAHVLNGPDAGKAYQLAALGKMGFENQVANPKPQDKTIVMNTDDAAGGPIYMYVGDKNTTGVTDVEKAGLTNGILYGVVVTGFPLEVRETALGSAKGVAQPFTVASLGNVATVSPLNAAGLRAAATAVSTTGFLRPEDGAWDPINTSDFYFVTTDRLDTIKDGFGVQVGRSRLWRMRFTNIATPETGGTITMLLDGTEAGNMFDNIAIDKLGHILIQEDTGGVAHNSKIWLYDIPTGNFKLVAKHDPARFGDVGISAVAPFDNNEESSGIIDATSILGAGWFLLDVQAHYNSGQAPGASVPINSEIFEGGQLVAMYVPEAAGTVKFTAATQIVSENVGIVTVTASLSSALSDDLTLPFTVSGSASFGSDHTLSNGSITIQAGTLSGAVTFNVVNDSLRETDETIVLTMTPPAQIGAGTILVQTVLVTDDDRGTGAAANDAVTTLEDTAVINFDVLANDAGLNGAKPSIVEFTQATNGVVVKNPDNTFNYTPSANFNGADAFTYKVSDVKSIYRQVSPTLVVVPNATAAQNIAVTLPLGGYGSAIVPVPGTTNEFFLLTDRGPNADGTGTVNKLFPVPEFTPQIGRFRVEADGSMTRLAQILLKREDGTTLLTGKPVPQGSPGATNEVAKDLNGNDVSDAQGLDSEALVVMADGTFWVSDEYGPFLVHFSATGTQLERINPVTVNAAGHKLPAVLQGREINRGMEGLCVTPDGTTLIGIMQSSLQNDTGTRNAAVRIVAYKIADGTTKQYVYVLDKSSGTNNSAVSEITAVSNTEFLVLERDGDFPQDSATSVKKVYKINIANASDISDPADTVTGKLFGGLSFEKTINGLKNAAAVTPVLATNGIVPVTKTLFVDVTKFKSVYNHDKMEGMCLINGGQTLVIANDDDFVLGTDTAGTTNSASRVTLKKSVAGVVDSSELLFIDLTSATVNVTVTPVNDLPSFKKGLDQTVAEDAIAQSVSAWATEISAGPANEAAQTLSFIVSNDNLALFLVQPAIDATGKLTYTPAANANGVANVTVALKDNGGGTDTSATQTFKITVTSVNDLPVITSAASATPLQVKVNESVSFFVSGTDPEGTALNYDWDFGDSTPHDLTGALVKHSYAVAGVYNVSVKVKDVDGGFATSTTSVTVIALDPPAPTPNTDTDGDGFSDEIETALGTNKLDATSKPGTQNAVVTPTGLTISKLSIKLGFVSGEKKDTITVSGAFPIPKGFSPSGKKLVFNVGGVVKSVTLNEKFGFKDDSTVLKLSSEGKFTLAIKKGSFLSVFADEGFTNQSVKGLDGKVRVTVIIEDKAYIADKRVEFTAKSGKGGLAK